MRQQINVTKCSCREIEFASEETFTGEIFCKKIADLKKAFDRVAKGFVWWALMKLSIGEWLDVQ